MTFSKSASGCAFALVVAFVGCSSEGPSSDSSDEALTARCGRNLPECPTGNACVGTRGGRTCNPFAEASCVGRCKAAVASDAGARDANDAAPIVDAAKGAADAGDPEVECDGDPAGTMTAATVDLAMPAPLVGWLRDNAWGCMHRQWHDVRQYEFLFGPRLDYANKHGWKAAARQEGAPGNGLDFLAMHRAMLFTLRSEFPQYAEYFRGWGDMGDPTNPFPTDPASATDPLPLHATTPFDPNMTKALDKVQNQLLSFPSEDELGLYLETDLRPTAQAYWGVSTDPTTGIHNYLHGRWNDPQSPVRMGNFTRNIENQTFWRLHGWLDGRWTAYRKAKGLDDAADAAYLSALTDACRGMMSGDWDAHAKRCAQAGGGMRMR